MLYTQEGASYSEAVVGDILCTDLTIVKNADYSTSGKTGIGVVFSNASGKLKVVGLSQGSSKYWAPAGTDTSIANIAAPIATNIVNDLDGRANTTILYALSTNVNYIAGYCRAYSVTGAPAGTWNAPAGGEWVIIMANLATINSGISTCSGTQIYPGGYNYYWVSSETDANNAIAYGTNEAAFASYSKEAQLDIRPIMEITY
ncbi:MAG: hypothetical protein M0R37_12850 [Bacteroidales bacterium]|nr:hypothetical protein [Bacteroidales bacterium]